MNLRDWLIIVGVVIIIGILLDGYRRMRLARKDSLKMSLEMVGDIDTSPLDDGFNSELPGGGARVIKPGINENEVNSTEDKLEPHISAVDLSSHTLGIEVVDQVTVNEVNSENLKDEQHVLDSEELLVADSNSRIEVKADDKPISTSPTERQTKKTGGRQVAKAGKVGTANKIKANAAADQLVIVLNVHSQEGSFPGVEIKKLLEACGLDHGDMSIFHRHEEDDLLSPIQFSVANAVEPGYFDPDTLSEIATPGVSFFMSLPGPKNYMKAFDYMLETAQCFARNLKGDLKDQDRSIMTPQTIEHCRQQVKEFERKQLSKNRI
jgi:cell division protein ZipA